jgi:hypothetical protein
VVRPTLLSVTSPRAGQANGTIVRSVFQGSSHVHVVDMGGTQVTVESIADERHAAGAKVDVSPLPGALFALLDG